MITIIIYVCSLYNYVSVIYFYKLYSKVLIS